MHLPEPHLSGDFNHKYATTDYLRIDPAFGTEADLIELVEKAHSLGIRVILDGVFNHVGIHFAPFMDFMEKGEKSAYRDWFYPKQYPVRIDPACYECVGDYPYMPRLNGANPEVRTMWRRCCCTGWSMRISTAGALTWPTSWTATR